MNRIKVVEMNLGRDSVMLSHVLKGLRLHLEAENAKDPGRASPRYVCLFPWYPPHIESDDCQASPNK